MHLLIDTWNVLHQTGILPPEDAGIGISGLVKMVKKSRWSREKCTLVCDGTATEQGVSNHLVQTVFTGPNLSADDEIVHRVQSSSSSRSMLVVTSDREIIQQIKAAGSQHLSSAVFLHFLVEDNLLPESKRIHRPTGLSSQDAQEWKQLFDIDEKLIEELDKTKLPRHLRKQTPKPQAPLSVSPTQKNKKISKTQSSKAQSDEPALPQALLDEARRMLEN